jgi:hypothetical protein
MSFLSCVLLLSAVACQGPGKPGAKKLTGAGWDMFTPVKMRLHPLSRLITSPPTVEARLEFTDQFGDIEKSVGMAHFELFAYDVIAFAHKGKRLGQWDESLVTPDDNRNHWDAITRTYLFKLSPDGALAGHDRVVLAATFTLPNGEKLSDEITLPPK